MAGFANPFMKGPDFGGGFQDMFARIMQMMFLRQLMGQQQPQKQQPQARQPMPQYPTGTGGFSLGQQQQVPFQMGGQAGMGQMNPMLMQFLQMMQRR